MKNTFESNPRDKFPDSFSLVVGSPEQRHRQQSSRDVDKKTRIEAGVFGLAFRLVKLVKTYIHG